MLSPDFVILTAVAYVCLLFVLAYGSDVRAGRGQAGFLRSPMVYTLSTSVYCTSWTFYGAVGTAARDGLEFVALYMGPTLVFGGWWFILRKLVWVSHSQGITSIADLLSSRLGKSSGLAVLVTLIAMVTITPYIALQLKAIATSIQTVSIARGHGDRLGGGWTKSVLDWEPRLAWRCSPFFLAPATLMRANSIWALSLPSPLRRRSSCWR